MIFKLRTILIRWFVGKTSVILNITIKDQGIVFMEANQFICEGNKYFPPVTLVN